MCEFNLVAQKGKSEVIASVQCRSNAQGSGGGTISEIVSSRLLPSNGHFTHEFGHQGLQDIPQ